MAFTVSWHTLLEELEELSPRSNLATPLSHKHFHIDDTQEHRVIIEFAESDEKRPLQREQFETLFHRINDNGGHFDLDRLPPDGEPYPAVLSLHPRFEVDERRRCDYRSRGSYLKPTTR